MRSPVESRRMPIGNPVGDPQLWFCPRTMGKTRQGHYLRLVGQDISRRTSTLLSTSPVVWRV